MKVNMSVISNKENHEIIKVKGDNNLNVIIYANGCMATVLSGECDDEPRFICGLSRNLLLNTIKDNELSDHIIKIISTKGSKIKMTDDLYSISKSVLEIVKNNTKKSIINYNGKQVELDRKNKCYTFNFDDGTSISISFVTMYSLVVNKEECGYDNGIELFTGICGNIYAISKTINNTTYIIEINENSIDMKEIYAYKMTMGITYDSLYECVSAEISYSECVIYIKTNDDKLYHLYINTIDLLDLFSDKFNIINGRITTASYSNIKLKCDIINYSDHLKIKIYNGTTGIFIRVPIEGIIKNIKEALKYNIRTGK